MHNEIWKIKLFSESELQRHLQIKKTRKFTSASSLFCFSTFNRADFSTSRSSRSSSTWLSNSRRTFSRSVLLAVSSSTLQINTPVKLAWEKAKHKLSQKQKWMPANVKLQILSLCQSPLTMAKTKDIKRKKL